MKTRNLLLAGIITLSGMFGFTSCDKDDETVAEDLPATETEAAEMVASSLAGGTSGAASDIETVVSLANEAVAYESNLRSASVTDKSLSCGESADTTIVTAATGVITYNNTKTYNYTLACDESGNPLKLDVSFSYSGKFDAPRLGSTHSVSGDFEITQIEYTSDMYLINGTWQRSGGFESKIRNKANRQATIQFELVNVAVEKNLRKSTTAPYISPYQVAAGAVSSATMGRLHLMATEKQPLKFPEPAMLPIWKQGSWKKKRLEGKRNRKR